MYLIYILGLKLNVYKYEYDENGNITHLERSNGYEEWKKYDEKGNLISYRNIDDIHFEIIVK